MIRQPQIKGGFMKPIANRLMVMVFLLVLLGGTTGCFLNVFQTADTVESGEFVFWSGLGVLMTSTGHYDGLAPQVHARYGLAHKLDIGLGSGFSFDKDFNVTFLGVMGDLRYQLNASPAVSIGLITGNFPFFGDVLSGGTIYLSQRFGSVAPYGAYRFWVLFHGGELGLSHQATIGVEVFNKQKVPAVFEVTWKDGRFMFGFALRF